MYKLNKSRLAYLNVFVLVSLFSSGIFAQTTINIGTGSANCSYPFSTYWECGRTQLLYTTDEIESAGGFAGTISAIGFDVTSCYSIQMENFYIRIRNISDGYINTWISDSMTTCYEGTYAVPGNGWQMIPLQTPFDYDGRNLLVEICYTNDNFAGSSVINGTAMTQHSLTYSVDNSIGCELTAIDNEPARPNLRIEELPFSGIASSPDIKLAIYPNPVVNLLNINSSGPIIGFEITDLAGNPVLKGTERNYMTQQINTSALTDGLYFINIRMHEGYKTMKIVIAH